MPQRDPGVYLKDIEHYQAAAVRFTSGLSLEELATFSIMEGKPAPPFREDLPGPSRAFPTDRGRCW
jgi:hypothetical protein